MKGDYDMEREEMERIFKAEMKATPAELMAANDLVNYTHDRLVEMGRTDKSNISVIASTVLVYYGKELAAKEGRTDE